MNANLLNKMGVAAAVFAAFAATAADFPSPDAQGTVTLTEAGEYAASLPGGATKLVVSVGGKATLSQASTAFTGPVEVKSGSTLVVTHKDAISKASSVTVESGATFEPILPGPGQTTALFTMPINIAGTGNGTGYAFRFTQNGGAACPDSVVNHLVLTADATINCSSRWGVSPAGGKGLIDLQGHTLTLTGGSQFMFFSTSLTPGKLLKTSTGTLMFQTLNNKPYQLTGDATNTVMECKSGTVSFWASTKPVPYKMVFNGSWLMASDGNGIDRNVISGPVEINNWITSYTQAGRSFTLAGPVKLANCIELHQDGSGKAGTLYVTGKVTKSSGKDQQFKAANDGTVVLQADDIGNPQAVMQNGSYVFNSNKGDIDMFRCANGADPVYGVFRQVKGDLGFSSGDTIRIGEGVRSFGAYVLESGAMRPKNTDKSVFIARESSTAHGFFLQKGGLFTATGSVSLGCDKAEAFFVQTGGTNTTRTTKDSQSWKFNAGPTGGSNIVFSVSGSNTLFKTDTFFYGDSDQKNPVRAVFSIKDGATFKATRFLSQETHPAGTHVTLWLDGGVICPELGWGWNGQNGGTASFYKRKPEKTIVAEKGITFDLTETGAISECPLTFEKPEGQGIKAIALPTDVSGFSAADYHGPVPVDIVGPKGSYGASAYAEYDFAAKKLSGIVVLTPGCNYDETTKIYLRSPNANASYPCASFTLTGEQKSGGLTKRGKNELLIYCASTYTGGTTIESGTLNFKGQASFPENTPLCVKAGASLANNEAGVRVSRLSGQGKLYVPWVMVTESLDVDAAAFADGATAIQPTYAGAKVTFADGAVVNLTLTEAEMAVAKAKRFVTVLSAPGGIIGSPKLLLNGATADGWRAKIVGNVLKVGHNRGFAVIVR